MAASSAAHCSKSTPTFQAQPNERMTSMRKATLSLTGELHGTLTVTEKGSKPRYWKYECSECGGVSEAPGSRLKAGLVKCRCQQPAGHGHAKRGHMTPEYKSWRSMKARCHRDRNYADVDMDPRWNAFEPFLTDMGSRPEGYSLDRKDPFGDYTPENVRWAPLDVQTSNKRGAGCLRYDCAIDQETGKYSGAVMTPAEWAWYLRELTGNQRWTIQKLWDCLEVLPLDVILRGASPLGILPEEYSANARREFNGAWDRYLKAVYLRAI